MRNREEIEDQLRKVESVLHTLSTSLVDEGYDLRYLSTDYARYKGYKDILKWVLKEELSPVN